MLTAANEILNKQKSPELMPFLSHLPEGALISLYCKDKTLHKHMLSCNWTKWSKTNLTHLILHVKEATQIEGL